jgi:hypothetical protein
MRKSVMSFAEKHLTASQKTSEQFQNNRAKDEQGRAEKSARLKALRLAKKASK